MKFHFPFLGKTREGYLDEGIRDFSARLSRFVQVEIPVLRTGSPGKGQEAMFRKQEAEQILARLYSPSLVVALDETGRQIDSPGLASLLDTWEQNGVQTVSFLLGGHLGLDRSVLERADLVLSLSLLTFTHEMARLILLEQLYRAWMIKSGYRYHN